MTTTNNDDGPTPGGGSSGTHPRWEKLTPAEMDAYAVEAQNEFMTMTGLDEETVNRITSWWDKHYLKCGHKRLGRILKGGL